MILLFLFFISEHGEEMYEGTEDEFAKITSSFMKRDQIFRKIEKENDYEHFY